MREQVAEATENLKSHNDHNLFYFDGQTIFSADLVQYLPDELHPDAEGYKFLAQNFQQQVIKTIFPGL